MLWRRKQMQGLFPVASSKTASVRGHSYSRRKRERTFAQKLVSSTGSPSTISSGEVTSNGSCRGSNRHSEVRGRAILPRVEADKLRKIKLRKALHARVIATGSWNDGITDHRGCSVHEDEVDAFVEVLGPKPSTSGREDN
jgi:hypothetical protein